MDNTFTEEELRELEQQLSCPKGEYGIELAELMNKSNISMTKNTIDSLELQDGNKVLEIGHGNCGHLSYLLEKAEDVKYYGIDISETMYKEAIRINENKPASFKLYDGEILPYKSNTFERILTVNTIYFWKKPMQFLLEIERVLKPGGICIISFGAKSYLKELNFVGQKFTLYDKQDITELVGKSSLSIDSLTNKTEQVTSKTGDLVTRKYIMAKLSLTKYS